MRILLIEDDARVASFIRRGLREEHYTVDVVGDGEEALFTAQTERYDLIILDLVLPKRPGLEVLRTLRAEHISAPILILTAKGGMEDKVRGLEAGGDDYLTKPFGFEELLARVRALSRRQGDVLPPVLRTGDIEIDVIRHRAMRGGKPLLLTNREYQLLEYFMRRPNQLVTRTMLMEHVWERDFDPLSNVIDVHVARLRQKITGKLTPSPLETIRGSGYILRVPAPDERTTRTRPSSRVSSKFPAKRASR